MISFHAEPLARNSSLDWVYGATPTGAFASSLTSFNDTNTGSPSRPTRLLPPATPFERLRAFAIEHDMDLLRRLAE